MGGLRAHVPEVIRRIHDTGAEVVLPDPIDDGAPRQHVAVGRDPVGQRRAAGALRFPCLPCKPGAQRRHTGERPRTNRITRAFDAAALQQRDRPWLDGKSERALRIEEIRRRVDPLRLAETLQFPVEVP